VPSRDVILTLLTTHLTVKHRPAQLSLFLRVDCLGNHRYYTFLHQIVNRCFTLTYIQCTAVSRNARVNGMLTLGSKRKKLCISGVMSCIYERRLIRAHKRVNSSLVTLRSRRRTNLPSQREWRFIVISSWDVRGYSMYCTWR